MRSILWSSFATVLLAAGPAFAGGGSAGDVELGIYGGFDHPDNNGNTNPKNGALYGGRLGFFFTPNWSIEASGQRFTTKTEFDTFPGVPPIDIHIDSFRGNLFYNFLAGQMVRPFLTGGAGYQRFELVDNGKASNFEWNGGAGLRFFPTPHWNIRVEGRYVGTKIDEIQEAGTTFALETQNQHNIEGDLGISYLFGGTHVEPAAAVSEPPANQPPTVTCAAERSEILPGETVAVHATASDPDGDALSYEWSATGGHVTGTGPNATLDFTGATAPAAATVTVHVSDGHGHTATSDCAVSLSAPVKAAAEAVSCLAGGFPRNMSRLTNVDKACLDDVAQRLQSDPRASVTVIGYADARETSAQRIGEQRATAVKNYLVSERHIDAARITVRSAGSTKPVDTGTDAAAMGRNRRVEVWFVPEGATIPGQ